MTQGYFLLRPEAEAHLRQVLGDVYYSFGELEGAAHEWHKAFSLQQTAGTDAVADMVENLYSLAVVMSAQGHPEEAVGYFQDALALGKAALGPEHPRIVLAEWYLAKLSGDEPQLRARVAAYLRIVERHLRTPGAAPEDTSRHLARLVTLYLWSGDFIEAEPFCRKLLALDIEEFGGRHIYTAYAKEWLGIILEARGEFAEAERLLRDAVNLKTEALYPRAPEVGRTLVNLGRVVSKRGRLAEAEQTLSEALAILEVRSPAVWMRHEALSARGGMMVERGQFVEAEPLLLNAARELERDAMTLPGRTREAVNRIIRLYEAWDKPEQAAAWRTKLEQWQATAQPVAEQDDP